LAEFPIFDVVSFPMFVEKKTLVLSTIFTMVKHPFALVPFHSTGPKWIRATFVP
jgi:hypothetical protein